jgi:hypothetical protein
LGQNERAYPVQTVSRQIRDNTDKYPYSLVIL